MVLSWGPLLAIWATQGRPAALSGLFSLCKMQGSGLQAPDSHLLWFGASEGALCRRQGCWVESGVGLLQRGQFSERSRGSLSEGLDSGPGPRTTWFRGSRETLANSGYSSK